MGDTFWTNFWTALSGLGGAIIGAGIAAYFQHSSNAYRLKEEHKGILCKYSIFLDKVCGISKLINDNFLKSRRDDPIRHLNLPPMIASFPPPNVGDPAIELYFLTESDDESIIARIINFKDRYAILLDSIAARNSLHVSGLQKAASALNLQSGTYTSDQIIAAIGRALDGQMRSATDTIYDLTDDILSRYAELRKDLSIVFKKTFPKAKLYGLTNDPNRTTVAPK
jgi:hypothetical protein